jgi:16S rRNA G966 N2-methylase RsmD
LDPPYFKNYYLKTLQEIDKSTIINEGGLIIVQHSTNVEVKSDFKNIFFLKERKYGNSKITIFYINYKNI